MVEFDINTNKSGASLAFNVEIIETEDEREIGTVASLYGRSGAISIKRPLGIKQMLSFQTDEANRWKVKYLSTASI